MEAQIDASGNSVFHFSLQLHKHEGRGERDVCGDAAAPLADAPSLSLRGCDGRPRGEEKGFSQQDVDVPPTTAAG